MLCAGVIFPPDIFDPRLVASVDSESRDIGGATYMLYFIASKYKDAPITPSSVFPLWKKCQID